MQCYAKNLNDHQIRMDKQIVVYSYNWKLLSKNKQMKSGYTK